MQEQATFEIRLLQTPSITLNGRQLSIRLKKAEAAFYYLLLEKSVSRDTLAAMIWGREARDLARRHLRDCIYSFNKQLNLRVIVAKDRYSLELNPEYSFRCDIDSFLENPDEVSAYRGPFLQDFHVPESLEYEEWVEFNRTRFQEEYLQRRFLMAQSAIERAALPEAERHLLAYLQYEPLSEQAVLLLMKVYSERKEYSKAAARYQQLRQALAEELGIAPLKETAAAYAALMERWNDAAMDERPQEKTRCIGRSDVLSRMRRNIQSPERAKHLILCGNPGVGKTFLLNQFLKLPEVGAYHVITSSCYQSKTAESMYPWQMIASRLLGLLEPSAPQQPYDADLFGKYKLCDIQSLMISASQEMRLLLVLEDIQWIDEASLKVLDSIVHQLPADRLCMVFTCRNTAPEPVRRFLSAMQTDRLAERISLVPFTSAETAQVIDAFGGGAFSDALKEKLFKETQGNAYLLFQMVDFYLNSTDCNETAGSPAQILEYRMRDLDDRELRILNIIAMFPDGTPWEILCQLSGEALGDLTCICQELIHRNLIRDIDRSAHIFLVFASEEGRRIIYQRIPRLNRRVLHRSIAALLIQAEPVEIPDSFAMAEYHYRQGGDAISALNCKVKSLRLYTNAWLYCFSHNPFAESSEDQVLAVFAETENRIDQLRTQCVNTKELERVYADLELAKLAFVIYGGVYEQMHPALDILLSWPESGADVVLQAHILAAEYAIQVGDPQLMRHHTECGYAIAEQREDWCSCEKLERYRGLYWLRQGNFSAAREKFNASILIAGKAFEQGAYHDIEVAYAVNYTGDSYYWESSYDEAIACYKKAVALAEKRSPSSCSAFLSNLGRTYFVKQDYAAAQQCFDRALAGLRLFWRSEWSIYCTAFLAIYACAEHDDAKSVKMLEWAESFTNAYRNPGETQIVLLSKAIIRKRLDEQNEVKSPLAQLLNQPALQYVGQILAHGKMEPLCAMVVSELFMKSSTTEHVFPGLWGPVKESHKRSDEA